MIAKDVAVMTCHCDLTDAQREKIEMWLQGVFPDMNILILDDEQDLSIIHVDDATAEKAVCHVNSWRESLGD